MSNQYPRFYIVCGVVLICLLVGIVFVVRDVQHFESGPPVDVSKIKGPMNAPIQIEEYSDLQCPACMRAHFAMKEMMEKYPDKIRLSYNHFPLSMHKWAKIAHRYAQCAAGQDQFWAYHDLLFEHQKEWSKSSDPNPLFLRYAWSIDLNKENLLTCLDDPATMDTIAEDVSDGRALQVRSTPTFYVNGTPFVGGRNFKERFEKYLRKELGLEEEK